MKTNLTPAVSVIIPVYNTGKHLHKAIQSILNQTFIDFELLLINDGSTDSFTISICQSYEKKDSRIRLVSKKNEGIELSRRKGIELSRGEYLVHMDHDDWYAKDALAILYNTAIAHKVDIVVADNYRVYPLLRFFQYKTKNNYNLPKLEIINQTNYLEKYYINFFGINQYGVSTWSKMYRKALFDLEMPICLGHNLIEDVVFNIQVFPKAKKIAFINNCIYYYKYGGLTSHHQPLGLLESYADLYEFKEKYATVNTLPQAIPTINHEMKNVLKHVFNEIIEFKLYDRAKAIAILSQFSNHAVYYKMRTFYTVNAVHDKFSEAIRYNDFAKMYDSQYESALKTKFKTKIKRFILTNFIR